MLKELAKILLQTIGVLMLLRVAIALVPRSIKRPIKWITRILWRVAKGTANMLKIAFKEFAPKKHKKVTIKQPSNVIKVVFPNNKKKEYKAN